MSILPRERVTVAPYAGAWIEIHEWIDNEQTDERRPLRGGVD